MHTYLPRYQTAVAPREGGRVNKALALLHLGTALWIAVAALWVGKGVAGSTSSEACSPTFLMTTKIIQRERVTLTPRYGQGGRFILQEVCACVLQYDKLPMSTPSPVCPHLLTWPQKDQALLPEGALPGSSHRIFFCYHVTRWHAAVCPTVSCKKLIFQWCY